ncbi:hypothetical protein HHK36_017476 [Tetracentron sinense]|uniref:DUF538 domain-containing protein n=1 Tax=Tetracentron sinense TaxID=13715 RepID=A0A834Z4E4_TETSI|nr:hypothetical protein HHK36_017476 [Tetracentron sinense]
MSLCFLSLLYFSRAITDNSVDLPTVMNNDFHDLLPQFGFPKGILPDGVKSYSISDDGDFKIELERPCYVQFDELVYYDKKINGKMRYGVVSDVSGIQAKKLFVWVPVTGMEVDSDSGLIEFHVGFLSEKLPADQFQTIPICKSKAYGGINQESSLISEVIYF